MSTLRTRRYNGVLSGSEKGPHEVKNTARAAEIGATSVASALAFAMCKSTLRGYSQQAKVEAKVGHV